MKKTIIALAAAGAASFAQAQVEGLSASASFGYESTYVFRGVELADNAIQSSVDISYMGAYAGIWGSYEALDDNGGPAGSETDFYAGYAFDIDDTFTLDFGGTAYVYPDGGSDSPFGVSDTFEIYGGVGFDVLLEPALYVFYDFDLELTTVEASGAYSLEVYENTSLDFGGALGYWTASDFGSQWYLTVSADAVYALAENASVSIGPRFNAFDFDGDGSPDTDGSRIWWGASFSAGF